MDVTAERVNPAEYAGWRRHSRSQQTGTLVVLLNTAEAGLDPSNGCAWTTLCDTHDSFVCHATRKLAEFHMADPAGWCEGCQEIAGQRL